MGFGIPKMVESLRQTRAEGANDAVMMATAERLLGSVIADGSWYRSAFARLIPTKVMATCWCTRNRIIRSRCLSARGPRDSRLRPTIITPGSPSRRLRAKSATDYGSEAIQGLVTTLCAL